MRHTIRTLFVLICLATSESRAQQPAGPTLFAKVTELSGGELGLVRKDGSVLKLADSAPDISSSLVGHDIAIASPKVSGDGSSSRLQTFKDVELLSTYKLRDPVEKSNILTAQAQASIRDAVSTLETGLVRKGVVDPVGDVGSRDFTSLFDSNEAAKLLGAFEGIQSAYEQYYNAKNMDAQFELLRSAARGQADYDRIEDAPSRYKTLYGLDDNLSVYRLPLIASQSKSVVAIKHKNHPKPDCTGFLVANDLVLTARHCLTEKNYKASDLEVLFDYLETADPGAVEPLTRIAVSQQTPYATGQTNTRNDIVLLDLASAAPGRTPLCLDNENVDQYDAVYSFGFPEGNRMVFHGNGRVYLPFAVPANKFVELRKSVHQTEIQNLIQRLDVLTDGELEAHLKSLRNKVLGIMLTFDQQYVTDAAAKAFLPTSAGYRYYLGTKDSLPSFGIALDLSEGDSGAPIFTTKTSTQCVVGLLTDGRGPVAGLRVGFVDHESIVPMSAIIYDLERAYGPTIVQKFSHP